MTPKITIDDILTKSPEVLLESIRKREEEPLAVQLKQEISEITAVEKPKEQNKETPVNAGVDFRKMLKGTFLPNEEFVKENIYTREEYNFIVIGIENSSKRIRFNVSRISQVPDTEEVLGTLSLSREALTNSKELFPYKKGDIIILLDSPEVKYPVVGINPASRNIVLNVCEKLRYVKISKVKLADEEVYDGPPSS